MIEFFYCRIFGGLINDVKRKLPWYLSDFTDAFALQSVASIFFLYFACLTPIITFGGLLGDATEERIVSINNIILSLDLIAFSKYLRFFLLKLYLVNCIVIFSDFYFLYSCV